MEVSGVVNSGRRATELVVLGKGQRRNLSSMSKVLSMIFAAAQFLDSSCADYWNRAVRFGRPGLLEVCANSDSPLVDAVESAGGEGLRTSFWNGYDRTARRGRERLYVFLFSEETKTRMVFVTLSSFWSIITNVCLAFCKGLQMYFRECKQLGCPRPFCTTTQFRPGWNQNSLLDMTEKTLKAVSRPWLPMGFAATRKSIEPILADLDHISRRSASFESSTL